MFARVYVRIRDSQLATISLSFTLLATSHVASMASFVVESPRTSLTLSTLASSLASCCFLLMLLSILYRQWGRISALVPPLILVALPDIIVFSLSLLVSALVKRGPLKFYMLALSFSYLMRGLSIIMIPIGVGIYLLLFVDLFKTVATSVFALYHLRKADVI